MDVLILSGTGIFWMAMYLLKRKECEKLFEENQHILKHIDKVKKK